MKKMVMALFIAVAFLSCEEDDTNNSNSIDATIIGRWQLVGFDDAIRYEFTADKRYTFYADEEGVFPTLAEAMAENPNLTGNDWEYSGDSIIIDLNFGNYSKLLPVYKCGNYVIDLYGEDGMVNSTVYREDYDISGC